MATKRCPRCDSVVPNWQPVHLTCFCARVWFLWIMLLVVVLGLLAYLLSGILSSPKLEAITARQASTFTPASGILASTPTPSRTSFPTSTSSRTLTPVPTPTPSRTSFPTPTSSRTLTPVPTPTPSHTPVPTPTPIPTRRSGTKTPTLQLTGTVIVTLDTHLNVRSGPGADYSEEGELSRGDHLTILGRNARGDWLYVKAPSGLSGWVSAEWVQLNVSVNSIPVRATPISQLAPTNITDGRVYHASNSSSENSPDKAVDGTRDTWWSSGGDIPAWWQIDFDTPYVITSVVLVVQQTPAGRTKHHIYFIDINGQNALIKTFEGHTREGDTLRANFPIDEGGACGLRVETVSSPSWPAWAEIQVFGIPAGTSGAKVACPSPSSTQRPPTNVPTSSLRIENVYWDGVRSIGNQRWAFDLHIQFSGGRAPYEFIVLDWVSSSPDIHIEYGCAADFVSSVLVKSADGQTAEEKNIYVSKPDPCK